MYSTDCRCNQPINQIRLKQSCSTGDCGEHKFLNPNSMNYLEKIAADQASSQRVEVGGFSNSFRSNTLTNLEEGESFVIPEDYKVFERRIGDNKAQYINVQTDKGRTVEFYPTSICKIAFEVDENGKNIRENGRIVAPKRSVGDVVNFCEGRAIDPSMQSMKGCTIKYDQVQRIRTRAFGVKEEDATANDVTTTVLATWSFVGDKRPQVG